LFLSLVLRASLALAYSFLSLPPAHPPSLFPYTTLFRSHDICRDLDQHRSRPAIADLGEGAAHSVGHGIGNGDLLTPLGHVLEIEDRKSTRLNSSHEWISYAVFCLKKKKSALDRTRDCRI